MKTPEQLADEVIAACNLDACNCRATRGCRGTIIGAITEYGEAHAALREALEAINVEVETCARGNRMVMVSTLRKLLAEARDALAKGTP